MSYARIKHIRNHIKVAMGLRGEGSSSKEIEQGSYSGFLLPRYGQKNVVCIVNRWQNIGSSNRGTDKKKSLANFVPKSRPIVTYAGNPQPTLYQNRTVLPPVYYTSSANTKRCKVWWSMVGNVLITASELRPNRTGTNLNKMSSDLCWFSAAPQPHPKLAVDLKETRSGRPAFLQQVFFPRVRTTAY